MPSSIRLWTETAPPDEVADVFVHVEEERDNGLIISGAKVVATGSAITHLNFIAHYGVPLKKKEFALICTIPMGAPGIKLICRPSYSMTSAVMGSPFDYPLSSRLDENDTMMASQERRSSKIETGTGFHFPRRGGMAGTTGYVCRSSGFNRNASGYFSGSVFSAGSVERQV
jgi:4-hydroxyphenylacetate 3-hydroxylase N terminal